jgi:hypothetical protein
MRKILLGALIVVACFGGTLWALNTFLDGGTPANRPALAEPPPLKPPARLSIVTAPVAVAASAIRDAIEAQTPKTVNGTRDNPLGDLVGKVDISWNVNRGPLSVAGRGESLVIGTPISGLLRANGQLGGQVSAIGNLLGGHIGREINKLAGKPIDQKLDIAGSVTVTARPALTPTWRIEPNLAANVALAERTANISGFTLNVTQEVKPMLDRTVNEQMAKLQAEIRNDPALEQTARREWARMCRSIPLGAAAADMPPLWLEVKPVKAVAAQPKIDPDWVILTLGVHAETRITTSESKPDCPFPATLELVPPMEQGKVAIAVPIDLPFTELNRILEAQLKGKVFPEEADAPVRVTVSSATLAASGDRLLISLKVNAKESRSWFGLGADADVFVWGKPALDDKAQVLRLADLELDVESQAAFGLAGTAARAAIPYLKKTLEQQATVDLKPFAATAKKSIDTALNDFKQPADGVSVEARVDGLRLAGIEFDAKTLRIIAEVDGTARALVTRLAVQ